MRRLPMRWSATVFMLGLCGSLVAQTQAATSAPSSEKFPSEWYAESAQDPYHPLPPYNPLYATASAHIAPYSAVTFLFSEPPTSGGTKTTYGGRTLTMRDSAWRLRTDEEVQMGVVGKNGAAPSVKVVNQVEVNDPIAHCSFRWVEPAHGDTENTATVQCQPRSTAVPPSQQRPATQIDPTEAKMTRQVAETLHEFPGQTLQIEPLGQKIVAGLKAFGIRQTLIDTNRYSGAPQVTEIWWSPEIKEILLAKPIGEPAGRLGIEMRDIKLQEPDPSLFYPPAGYNIVPASQMPH
jgi:hypothetical protein